jgi:uncharacterized protein YdaU (DUF1376 family)
VNYVELHIGDYDKATAHLTACEDGIYGRLIRWYYDMEGPLPQDMKGIQRRVRARSRDEKAAVESVLEEFFEQADDGWHHKRCDEEIAKYREGQEEAAAKRENEAERQKRHRQRRKELFSELREHDIVPKYDTSTADLESMLSRVTSRTSNAPVTRDIGVPVTRTATANQTPDTRHQYQEQEPSPHAPFSPDPPTRPVIIANAGRACLLLRQAGCARVNPSHPDLLDAIAEGVTPEAIRDTYGEKPDATNPFAWAITTARARHAEGSKKIGPGPPRTNGTPRISATMQVLQELEDAKNAGLDNPGNQQRIAKAGAAES